MAVPLICRTLELVTVLVSHSIKAWVTYGDEMVY